MHIMVKNRHTGKTCMCDELNARESNINKLLLKKPPGIMGVHVKKCVRQQCSVKPNESFKAKKNCVKGGKSYGNYKGEGD